MSDAAETAELRGLSAKAGVCVAAIFWLKTRAGWRETHIQEHATSPRSPIQFVSFEDGKLLWGRALDSAAE